MDEPTYSFPHDRYYDPEQHTWAQRQPDGTVRIGIDVLGLESLGDLAYVSLFPEGTAVRRGEALGTLEAAKMTGEIIAPLSGRVVRRNDAAMRDPYLVNQSPYDAGWLVMLEPEQWEADAAALVGGDRISEWVVAEIARYRAMGWIQ